MAKKSSEFKWKSEKGIGGVQLGDKKLVAISHATLDVETSDGVEERDYVCLKTLSLYKIKGAELESWNVTKNATFPLEAFGEIVAIVDDYLDKLDAQERTE